MLLSKTLVSIPRPESLTPMAVSNKLKYKKVNREDFWPESGKLPSLSALMGPRSWLIPKRLGLTVEDMSWLEVPVENWSDYSGSGPLIILMVTAASKFLDFISGLFK